MQKFNIPQTFPMFSQQGRGVTIPTLSQIDLTFLKNYLRIDWEDDDMEILMFLDIAKGYIAEIAKCTEEELENKKIASICVLKVVSDFYNNRTTSATDVKIKLDPLYEDMLRTVRGYDL